MELTKEEVSERIANKLRLALELMDDCVALSEEHGVVFELPWGGEGTNQRGMGATYVPETASEQEKKWNLNTYDRPGWLPSGGTC
jgi:hypothetical protein